MGQLDFRPAARTMAGLIAATGDDQLGGPTPCPAYTVADLVDHIGSLTQEFTLAARKQPGLGEPGPGGGARLEDGWRERIGRDLEALAEAWTDPDAYEGTTHAGPFDLPAPVAATIALNEVVVHGWDLARATGQRYEPDPAAVEACLGFAESFDPPLEGDGGPFGPPVPVAAAAPAIDRLVGRTGRDPHWAPGAAAMDTGVRTGEVR